MTIHAAARWLIAALVPCLAACTSTLQTPADPRPHETVYLIDHGRHPSLVLPTRQGRTVRYAYGDWAWFARGDTGILAGVTALLWPTRGALGRQALERGDSPRALRRQIPEGLVHVYRLQLPAPAVFRLADRLERLHAAGRAQALHNPRFGLTFVPHPEAYWFPNNSNVVTARWLKEMGVKVSGLPLLSRWRLSNAASATGE